jgi:hypothetical protein
MDDEYSVATLLANGKVLFAGGGTYRSPYAQLYDPPTVRFASTGNMTHGRVWHSATLLPGGKALIVGGDTNACLGNPCTYAGSLANAELYDPSTGTFAMAGDTTARRSGHTATLLNDGRVLIAGGYASGGINLFFGGQASAELYTPPSVAPAPVLFSVSEDGNRQGAILHAGAGPLVAPGNPAVAGEALEIYLTGLAEGSVVPPQVSIGGRLAEILYFGPAPGLTGVNQVNVRVPSGVTPGNAVSVRMTYLSRHSDQVTIAVR